MLFHSLLLAYYLLIVFAASTLLGRLLGRVPGLRLSGFLQPLLGFALLPVLTAYAAFAGVTRLPWLVQGVGALLAIAGLLLLLDSWRGLRQKGIGETAHWWLWLPLLALGYLFVAKSCYLDGGLNNFDDLRSVGLTGALASNYLKPAFLYDFSIPLSYSYYLYEWSALLYAMVDGIGMPSVPVLAINLVAVWLFYRAMIEIAPRLPGLTAPPALLLLLAVMSFYGFDFLFDKAWDRQHLEWWNNTQITQLASYQHWTWQYLFTAALLLLGLAELARFIDQRDLPAGRRFVLLFALAAGFGAIPFVWAVLALIAVAVGALLRERGAFPWRESGLLLVQGLPLAALIILPGIFAFVGREVIVEFPVAPRPWHQPEGVTGLALLGYNLKVLALEIGPLLLAGLLALPRWWRAGRDATAYYLGWFALGLFVLSLMSTSTHFDWYSRGMLLLVLIAAFSAAELLWQWIGRSPQWALPLIGLALAPQLLNFSLEHLWRLRQCEPPPAVASKLNVDFSLGSLFFSESEANTRAIKMAGRAFIGPETGGDLITYRNQEDFLRSRLNWTEPYRPCGRTVYGPAAPDGVYLELLDGAVRVRSCDTE